MSVFLDKEEWSFEKLFIQDYGQLEGAEKTLQTLLIKAYEYSRELIQRFPDLRHYDIGGQGYRTDLNNYCFWKLEYFPSTPWYGLDKQVRSDLTGKWMRLQVFEGIGSVPVYINIDKSNAEILEWIKLAKKLWNETHNHFSKEISYLKKMTGDKALMEHKADKGGNRTSPEKQMVALGKERILRAHDGNKAEAWRWFKDKGGTVNPEYNNDDSFNKCSDTVETVISEIVEQLPDFLKEIYTQ